MTPMFKTIALAATVLISANVGAQAAEAKPDVSLVCSMSTKEPDGSIIKGTTFLDLWLSTGKLTWSHVSNGRSVYAVVNPYHLSWTAQLPGPDAIGYAAGTLDRVTGAFSESTSFQGSLMYTSGQCSPVPTKLMF